MSESLRPSPFERERAFGRLRGLTTSIAVAGIAGTAGFGALAATTYAGQPGAATVEELPSTAQGGDSLEGAGERGDDDSGGFAGLTNPFSGNGGGVQPPQSVRNGTSSHRVHVSTGGSR